MPTLFWLVPIVFLFIISYFTHWAFAKWSRGLILGCLVVITQANYFSLMTQTLFQRGDDIIIKGQVSDFFKSQNHGGKFTLQVRQINHQPLPWWYVPKLNVFLPHNSDSISSSLPQLGEKWQFKVTLKPIIGQLNQAGFDSEQYYLANGWHAKAVVDTKSLENNKRQDSRSPRNWLHQQAESMISNMNAAPYLLALSFGDRASMSSQDWQWLRDSGLSHLMAISGLHIGLAFFIGWWLGKRLMSLVFIYSHFDPVAYFLPYGLAILCAGIYAYLAGFSLPTERAFIFGLCFLFRNVIHIHWSLWQVLLFSLAIILVVQPFAVLLASFWLSFSAVMVIYMSSWFWVKTQSKSRTLLVKIINVCIIQLGLFIGLVATTTFIFGGFSWVSPLVNIIVVPWVSLLTVPIVFIALIMTLFTAIGLPFDWAKALWQLADWSFSPVFIVMKEVEGSWILASHVWAYSALLIAVLLLIVKYLGWYRSFVGLSILGTMTYYGFKPSAKWQVEVLDVGQGLAILIGQKKEWVLYDTGNRWEGGSMAQSVILPVLQQKGIDQLEGMIISHTDSDHAGGRDIIEKALKPKWKRSSQTIIGYQPCIAGERWKWKQLTFTVIWPPKLVPRAYNPHSCVIRITDGRYSVLLTGDIDALSEMLIARNSYQYSSILPSDILIVPHHGSKTSSSIHFVQQTHAEMAIASLAKNNQWGLPSPIVKQRYKDQGINWWDTGNAGQISIQFEENNWSIRSLRQQQYDPWYRQIVRKGLE